MTNELKELLVIQKVLSKTTEVTIGRGKNAIIKKVFKYKSKEDDELRKKINAEIQRLSGEDNLRGISDTEG